MITYLLLADALPKSPQSSTFWLPKAGSLSAGQFDWLYDFLAILSIVSVVGVAVAMLYLVVKYRARSRVANEIADKTPDHNTTLELTWSIIPLFIVMAIFVWGFKGYLDLRTPPKDALEVNVTGQKWNWSFTYSNGMSDNALHVPVNTPVRLLLTSVDVIHSLYIPAFRIKMDAVPGRYTEMWFQSTEAGEYPIFCAEYCGAGHSRMLSRVVVHEPGGYENWLSEQQKKMNSLPLPELGAQLYQKQGCKTCHSIDGSRLVGPSWKGLFGRKETMSDGTVIDVDANYIRESIAEPQKRIVMGFAPAMPTYQGKLTDRELTALIEYIKSLK